MPSQINQHRYVLILAGGSGTRLYPRSRVDKPKQFQSVVGIKTLLEQTIDRIINHIPIDHIYIITHHKYIDLTQQYFPNLPKENIILEPIKRNTAPAAALATQIIVNKDKDAIIASLHADHIVQKQDVFTEVLDAAYKTIEDQNDYIATIGIQPTSPHTGYGYIERSKKHKDIDGYSFYHVLQFVEKPNAKTALSYLNKGTFLWNAGYFIWQGRHFLNEIKRLTPEIHTQLRKISNTFGTKKYKNALTKSFSAMPDIPIDTAVMEKTKLVVLPADLGWSDVGSWDSVANLLDDGQKDANGSYCEGTTIPIDTYNSIILGRDRLIATIGLDNIVIVDSEDGILIAQRGRTEEVKKVVEELKQKKMEHLL